MRFLVKRILEMKLFGAILDQQIKKRIFHESTIRFFGILNEVNDVSIEMILEYDIKNLQNPEGRLHLLEEQLMKD